MPSPTPAALSAAARSTASATRSRATAPNTIRTTARAAAGPATPQRGAGGPPPKWKSALWAGLFAAVIFTGSIYGAGLKTQQEWKAEKQKVQEASVDEKVALLLQHRTDLMRQKSELDNKLADLRARMRAKEAEEGAGGGVVGA